MSVSDGAKVKIHYTGMLTDGTVFDSSEGKDPLEFEVGAGQVIKGFDKGVRALALNEKKTIEIPVDEGYGQYIADLVKEYPPEAVNGIETQVGQTIFMQSKDGRKFPCIVLEVSDEKLKVDFNHPLAGKDLVFDIELVDVK